MNLENEYLHLKQELKFEEENLAKFEAIDISDKTDEQIEARNRGIKSVKKSIEEIKELIEEVKEELKELIQNGGEVSQATIDELQEADETDPFEITVHFKIVSNKNENVYIEGYVDINDEEAEDVEWYYYDAQGFATQHMFVEHNQVDGFKGPTYEQQVEIDTFRDDYAADALWIDECILQSEEDENRTYLRENCTLIINEGAKMECEIREPDAFLNMGDYVVEVIPFFNGKRVGIASYMAETFEEFDPWDAEDNWSFIKNGSIFFEMSKDYWDDDCKEERLAEVNEEARRIYARALTRELGIYAKYGDVMEQFMDDYYENDWLFKMSQMVDKSDEELDTFLRQEGLIDEELEY